MRGWLILWLLFRTYFHDASFYKRLTRLAMPLFPLLSAPKIEKRCPNRLRSLLPPANFGAVETNAIYRSSYPTEENYEFLKSLKLKTIL
jgi:hypothetical protein